MRRRQASWVAFAAISGFLAGMAVGALLVAMYRPGREAPRPRTPAASGAPAVAGPLGRQAARSAPPAPAPVVAPARSDDAVPDPAGAEVDTVDEDVVDDLRRRRLSVPVSGVKREDLRLSFEDQRGAARRHEAIDILAPRHTQVVAVEAGIIVRLFNSAAGGITVYQFDPTTTFAYYYAHLERYADGLEEGAMVARGQVLGYVGTSGNAPANTPHLHFSIFLLTDDKRWWQGTPIDPYVVLK